MEPYLRAAGINYTRNDPATSAAAAIRESNAGTYDFHLALHSNAAGSADSGNIRGIDVYYYPTAAEGLAMANILVDNLRPVYPLPERVRALSTTAIGEVRRTRAPSAFLELGYHDNVADATWVENNVAEIARAISLSVTEYCLDLPTLTNRQRTMLQNLLTAKGRSYSDPVYNADGTVNMAASRRVEFKFRLKDSEMIEEMNRILSQMEE